MFGPTRDGGGDGVGYGATMTASIGFYLVCPAGMSIFNKLAITALPLPMTLVSIQMLFTVRARSAAAPRSRVPSRRRAAPYALDHRAASRASRPTPRATPLPRRSSPVR